MSQKFQWWCHVIVLDVYMPEASGPELTAVLRERDALLHVPILFLSAEADMTTDRVRIAEKIQQLGLDPDHPDLDTRKLEGEPGWRLRVGAWRIIYERQDDVKIIAIEKIKPRGDAYK